MKIPFISERDLFFYYFFLEMFLSFHTLFIAFSVYLFPLFNIFGGQIRQTEIIYKKDGIIQYNIFHLFSPLFC